MMEFFLFLGVIAALVVWNNIANQRRFDREQFVPRERPKPPTAPGISLNVTARSVDDIIGSYNGEKICRYVQLDDGRHFEFESIAVEQSPGVFHADKIDSVYIVVDKCLLYREIPV